MRIISFPAITVRHGMAASPDRSGQLRPLRDIFEEMAFRRPGGSFGVRCIRDALDGARNLTVLSVLVAMAEFAWGFWLMSTQYSRDRAGRYPEGGSLLNEKIETMTPCIQQDNMRFSVVGSGDWARLGDSTR